ncbi:hypothetical protein [Novosphingobium sp. Gsoil 351]|uniref:hypothetical protein n=1 Tax=Novosphingobium sp. Gsoil 351 TaxID=2675225 RepID=UPI001E3A53F7|nr:hypothetical protein [Novosphingobium sp. Gsoil 351]
MIDHPIRYFADDDAVRRVGEGFFTRSLPRAEWTHEAHLATSLWLILESLNATLNAIYPR